MNRIFDVIAVACVAVVVLLPKASVQAKPALAAEPIDVRRVAALEDELARAPRNETIAVELADEYLQLEHPDWALVTLSAFNASESSARLSLVRATAHAERLEAAASVRAIAEGEQVCATRGCPSVVAARLALIGAPMQALVDGNIDPHTDLSRAKEAVSKALHSTTPSLPPSLKK